VRIMRSLQVGDRVVITEQENNVYSIYYGQKGRIISIDDGDIYNIILDDGVHPDGMFAERFKLIPMGGICGGCRSSCMQDNKKECPFYEDMLEEE